ncbi:cystathionine beta-lyase/cystathionine gamma-synthase [Streptosporangium album]|uniref:Cystathionine beta-lyase/cystathionine gamma-synthase n=1 Tax=Streptosporangium album TaxID=47479 RepID=A0A7W7RSW4_9ACTN|nr:PLP-dependent transferase [Streptosporangium album]MBB4936998.1 cystathionine beta-lyase/cystathionine gamma-synthase [Streptosporangium album]
MTVVPHGGPGAGAVLTDALRLVSIAASAGGTRTKAAHLASTGRRHSGETFGADDAAVRFSIGLEDAEDLIMDVTSALDSLPKSVDRRV